MSEKLTEEEYRSLLWLSRQNKLVWGAIYDRGGDSSVDRLHDLGFIEVVQREVRVGRSVFRGGYQITDAGRRALASDRDQRDRPPTLGTAVSKPNGYPFPGEVRAVFTTKAGEVRYVVEATGPNYAGMLHIFSPAQIVKDQSNAE